MRLTLITIGSRGDVQPLVALGLALQRAGHAVTVATALDFAGFVTGHGLAFAPIALDMRRLAQSEAGQGWIGSGQNPAKALRGVVRAVRLLCGATLEGAWAACQGAEAVVFGSTVAVMAGYHLAERLRVPMFEATMQPLLTPTRAFAHPMVPPLPRWVPPASPVAAGYHWLTHLANQQIAWLAVRGQVNRWRVETLGLPPLDGRGPFRWVHETRLPILHAYSPAVVPRPADWPAWIHQTGYWFLDDTRWQPPADLLAFLDAGPPPVAIGFGSMSDREPAALTAKVVAALDQAGLRGVLVTGWGGLRQSDLPASLFAIQSVPHEWLFPRVAAAVHHGGAGTTAAALRAGVPAIVIPFFADQFFWARRVAALGAGPAPLPFKRLSAPRLAAALRRAVTDGTMRERGQTVGRVIREENGLAQAVNTIEAYLHSTK